MPDFALFFAQSSASIETPAWSLILTLAWVSLYITLFIVSRIQFRQYLWGRILALSSWLGVLLTTYEFLRLVIDRIPLHILGIPYYILWVYVIGIQVLAIASAPTRMRCESTTRVEAFSERGLESVRGMGRNPWVTLLIILLSFNFLWLFWLYRTVRGLRALEPGRFRFSPGASVAFILLPFFNVIWMIYLWIVISGSIARQHSLCRKPQSQSNFAVVAVPILFVIAGTINIMAIFFLLMEGSHYSNAYAGLFVSGELLFLTICWYCQCFLNEIVLEYENMHSKSNERVTDK